MRNSAWCALGKSMVQKDWRPVLNASSCEEKRNKLMSELNMAIDTFLPKRTIKRHPTDRPWVRRKPKNWIRKRQIAFIRYGKDSTLFKFWKNKIQREIKTAKETLLRKQNC